MLSQVVIAKNRFRQRSRLFSFFLLFSFLFFSFLFFLITHSKHLFKFYFKLFPELVFFKYNKNKLWNSFRNSELFFIAMRILLVVIVSLSKEFKKQGKLRLTWVLHIYISHSPSTVSFAFLREHARGRCAVARFVRSVVSVPLRHF